jgi:hypothetical protein
VRYPLASALTVAALFVSSCGRPDEPAAADRPAAETRSEPRWDVRVEPTQVPVGAASVQPQLTTSTHGLILSWLEQQDRTFTLKFAERTAGGWSPATTVASSADWFVSSADVPSVLRMSEGTLVAALYPATDASIEAYNLRLSYSRDNGKTWSRPLAPHHDNTTTQHGFATLFEMPGQRLGLVWLDGREQELDKTAPDGGSMSIYFTSFDSAWKQAPETAIDVRVCECCQTTAVMTADGPVVAFRDRSPREVRDINVSRLEADTWTQPRPLHVDGWQIEACPVNGPALSARGSTVAAAWFAAPNDMGHAFAAFSSDAGRSWGEPIRLDDDTSLGHVDIELLDDGSAVASWVEFTGERAQLRIREVKPSGERTQPVSIAGTGDGYVSGYPRLARVGSELMLAWTESAGGNVTAQQVKAATIRLQD